MTGAPHTIFFALRPLLYTAPEGSEASGGNLFHLPFPASAGISIYPLPSFIAIIAARQYTHSEYCQNCVRLYSLEGIVRA